MSEPTARLPIRATLAGNWHAPALVVGLAVFAAGVGQMFIARRVLTFEEELARVRVLRHADQLTRASAYIVSLLAKPDRPLESRGVLHAELASVIHEAESRLTHHNPRNLDAIIRNFDDARGHGQVPSADLCIAVGDAHRWAGDAANGVAAYLEAIKLNDKAPDRLRRMVAEYELARAGEPTHEVVAQVDAILADSAASGGNYLWALEQKIQWRLAAGDPSEAMRLVGEGRQRLAGTEHLPAVTYCEALCLREAGLRMEAEDLLRMLRAEWSAHDELWAKSGWLLGRLQQEDERPQAALSYYEEVLRAFRAGNVYDQCLQGRAESLAMLGRYETAHEIFGELTERLTSETPPTGIDRESVRVGVSTIAEMLMQDRRVAMAVEYFDLARRLVAQGNQHLQAYYLSRQAGALSELAASSTTGSGEGRAGAKALYLRAAEAYLSLVGLVSVDEAAAAAALEKAADNFDAAGEADRALDSLMRLVREFPEAPGRVAALHRIARSAHEMGDRDRAIAAYRRIITVYARTPSALQSYVPLADCLIRRGGDGVSEGVGLLLDIVDDRGPDPLFSPQALEYRLALFRLADYYADADPAREPGHIEKAITRLEDAIAFYPDDPQIARLRFQLAGAYRASAEALREDAKAGASELARADAQREADRRLEKALFEYDLVVKLLAAEDTSALSELERTRLRASYQYRGDCLFDLGRYDEAIVAYRETAWRYENLPAAIVAMMQVVQCHQRVGQVEEARAALARLGWLLRKTPASAFEGEPGMSSKAFWEGLVARLERTGIY